MMQKGYSKFKIFFAFLLSPFFAGLAAVPITLLKVMIVVFSDSSLMGEVRGGELLSLFITLPILAEIIFLFLL
ncbi:hypothetical protein SB759_02015 [Pseudomonas sp. SIMBA_059]